MVGHFDFYQAIEPDNNDSSHILVRMSLERKILIAVDFGKYALSWTAEKTYVVSF